MATHKAKQFGGSLIAALVAGLFFASAGRADNDGKSFLPVPGEVPPGPTVKPAPLPAPTPAPAIKTNSVPPAPAVEPRPHPAPNLSSSDWGTYNRDRATKVLLDGKLVDKSTLTPLIGFLVSEHAKLSDGHQNLNGAALDLAARKSGDGKVATAMELRPSLWRNTNERVFLLNYKSVASMPGALIRVYGIEIDPLEGWRAFKVGNEPSFEEWKRLGGH